MSTGGFEVLIVVLAIVVVAMIWAFSRMQTVGSLSVPVHAAGATVNMRLSVLREPLARDDAAVHILFSGLSERRELSSREALQLASWLEMGCERSDSFFGNVNGLEVSSTLENEQHVVQLTRHDPRSPTLSARLGPAAARMVAGWIRIGASPGATIAEARRRMPKAPA